MAEQSPQAENLWVFAQYPVKGQHLLIPVIALTWEEAVRIVEADPQLIGKPLTDKVVAGQPGVTDGERDFIIFQDANAFFRFLQQHKVAPVQQ